MPWGNGTAAKDRVAVCLEYRLLHNGPAFKVIDAGARGKDFSTLAEGALPRSEVIGTALAGQVFAIGDLILAKDKRVAELLGGWTVS